MEYQALANVIKILSADACENAKSGHPGMPLGMADICTVLWQKYLRFNPQNPDWFNRDRFILSNGHGSMLQYALLHLTGYAVSIDDIRNFRRLGSITAGHPEFGECPGVETTTGPLGQGLANAVGMALAYRHLQAKFNQPDCTLLDPKFYVTIGDGCLMEGISHEACSLAGVHQLDNLIVIWDDNGISIDGEVEGWWREDVKMRFQASGWEVIGPIDGHDFTDIDAALHTSQAANGKPKLIIAKTTIGHGAPTKQGTSSAHGAPLGPDELEGLRSTLKWPHASFKVPEEAYAAWSATERGAKHEKAWNELASNYQANYPKLYAELTRIMTKQDPPELAQAWADLYDQANAQTKPLATRKASLQVLTKLHPCLPEMIGGSADLTESNCTLAPGIPTLTPDNPGGNYIHYGVREFGMTAVASGIALAGLRPFAATFLVFTDYARSAIRMAALMNLPCIYVMTHDSIGLGEDGPTHQPIEHLSSLRLIPNLEVWRPADLFETVVAWQAACQRQTSLNQVDLEQDNLEHSGSTQAKPSHVGPVVIALSRQNLPPVVAPQRSAAEVLKHGGYVINSDAEPTLVLIGTGSEVGLVVEASKELRKQGLKVRTVSLPCVDRLTEESIQHLCGTGIPKLVIEAGSSLLWPGILGDNTSVVGIDSFGASGRHTELFDHFGFNVADIITKALEIVEG